MRVLAANLLQVGMLGLGVSLLLLWINYLKANHNRILTEEPDDCSAEVSAATRSRIGP
jgi:hypothetical protein